MAPATLPEEMIQNICSFADRATCAAMCLTGRTGNRIARPILYNGKLLLAREGHEKRGRRLKLLCRTLVENRELASSITDLAVYIDRSIHKRCKRFNKSELEKCARLLVDDTNLPSVVCDLVLAPHRDAKRITHEAYLVLLLVLCNSLTKLTLQHELTLLSDMDIFRDVLSYVEEARDDESDNSFEMDGSKKSHDAGIYTINEIYLESARVFERNGTGLAVGDIEHVLHFPGLRKLHINYIDASLSKGRGGEPGYLLSGLQELYIESYFGKEEELNFLLNNLHYLRRLELEFSCRQDAHRRFDWRHIGNTLREHCPNLQHLRIDHPLDFMMQDEDLYEMGAYHDDFMDSARLPGLGSLRSLTCLETAVLPQNAILGKPGRDIGLGGRDISDAEDDDGEEEWEDEEDELDAEEMEEDLNPADLIGSSAGRRSLKLDAVLPDSLHELTVITEDVYLDLGLLNDPIVSRLKEFTVINCNKDHWSTKTGGEGRRAPPQEQQSSQTQPQQSRDNSAQELREWEQERTRLLKVREDAMDEADRLIGAEESDDDATWEQIAAAHTASYEAAYAQMRIDGINRPVGEPPISREDEHKYLAYVAASSLASKKDLTFERWAAETGFDIEGARRRAPEPGASSS